MTTSTRGFTLIELMVTVIIVGLLATVALPMAELTIQRAKEQELHAALQQIRTAIDAYKLAVDEGRIIKSLDRPGYPPTLDALVDGVPDAQSPTDAKLYFLRSIPRDPMMPDPSIPAADTWGKRSYESSHDDPQEGDDVFDVYSKAPGVGLNGIPYREW
jgi:general secretion pathway protein G